MVDTAGLEPAGAAVRPLTGVDTAGRDEQLLPRRLLELAPAFQRTHGHPDVVGLRVREAKDAAGAVGGAARMPQLELLEEHTARATLGERPRGSGPDDARTDDDRVHPLHAPIVLNARG